MDLLSMHILVVKLVLTIERNTRNKRFLIKNGEDTMHGLHFFGEYDENLFDKFCR